MFLLLPHEPYLVLKIIADVRAWIGNAYFLTQVPVWTIFKSCFQEIAHLPVFASMSFGYLPVSSTAIPRVAASVCGSSDCAGQNNIGMKIRQCNEAGHHAIGWHTFPQSIIDALGLETGRMLVAEGGT